MQIAGTSDNQTSAAAADRMMADGNIAEAEDSRQQTADSRQQTAVAVTVSHDMSHIWHCMSLTC